jgi:hypothetical protein
MKRRDAKFFRLHDHAESYDGRLGAEVAYLYEAIANDTFMFVAVESPLVALLRRENIGANDAIWRYLDFGGTH